MNKLKTGALALALAASLAACSSSAEPTATPSAAPNSASTTTPATPATPATPTAEDPTPTQTPTSNGTPPAPTADGTIDQGTPEAVMTAWLNALVDGKTADICTLTAVDGKLITDVKGGKEQCTKGLGALAGSLKSAGSLFEGLTITGATITGDKATFEKATTKPELAAQVIASLAAVKIGSKWYITTP